MENQVKTNTDQKEQQLKKISKMSMIRALLPIAGLIIIFLLFNVLTNFRMMKNLPLVLSQVYVTMIAATGVFFIMTMGGLDFSQGSILGIASIVVCMISKTSIPLAIVGGIVAGAVIGAINGYFYVYRKIKSFIVTICTMFLFRGFIKYLTTNAPVAGSAKLINFDSTGLKIACTVLILAIGFVLELTGYVPNTVQSLATQNSIRVLMCVVPTIGVILAYVVFKSKYKLDDKFMKKVVAKLNGSEEK